MSETREFHWATLGCGVIANELANALAKQGRKLYSVANRTHDKAVAFAEKYGIDKVYDSIDEVFDDPNVLQRDCRSGQLPGKICTNRS